MSEAVAESLKVFYEKLGKSHPLLGILPLGSQEHLENPDEGDHLTYVNEWEEANLLVSGSDSTHHVVLDLDAKHHYTLNDNGTGVLHIDYDMTDFQKMCLEQAAEILFGSDE